MAVLVTPNDFRSNTQAEYCYGLQLTPDDADDTRLTALIARATVRVNEFCADSFDGEGTKAITLDGSGESTLVLPKRCTAVSQVQTLDNYGNLTTQQATSYRLHSSLTDSGSRRLDRAVNDWLAIPYPGLGLLNNPYSPWRWYPSPQSVIVTGTWGWTTPPADIRRAVAVVVFDQAKPIGSQTVRATRWMDGANVFDINTSMPTGIVEVDMLLHEYNRRPMPYVALG
jgi:hypothetical protein